VKIHIGHTVEQAVRNSGMSITALADRLKVSRKTIYNYFDDEDLDQSIVIRFEKMLNVSILPDSAHLDNNGNPSWSNSEKEAAYWRAKYIDLLERYTQLLENHK
jgi:predicted transcriptional regulator